MGLNLAFSWREGTEPDGEKQEMKKAKNLKVNQEGLCLWFFICCF